MKKIVRLTLGLLSLIAIVLMATGVVSYADVVDHLKDNGIMYGMAAGAGEVVADEGVTTENIDAASYTLLSNTISNLTIRILIVSENRNSFIFEISFLASLL